MGIGLPWDGAQENATEGAGRVHEWDTSLGRQKLAEHNWGLQFINELGQPWDQPLVKDTDDPEVKQIGDEFFRRIPRR